MTSCSAGRSTACHGAHATNSTANRNEQLTIFIEIHLADPALKKLVAIRYERPSISAVGRFVDTDAGFRITRSVRFAGRGINSVRIGGMDEERSDRVRPKTVRQ